MKRITNLLFCLISFAAFSQTTIFLEDFEDAQLTYTTSIPDDLSDIAASDYFGRIDDTSGLPISVAYSNLQGSGFYGVQDPNGANSGDVNLIQLDWTGIDISGFSNLNLSWYVAEDDANDGNEDWDSSDFVRLEVQVDGGGFTSLFAIESEGGTNTAPRVDTDFDGLGDGIEITDVFTQFSSDIANGSMLDIRLTINGLSVGDEDIAFDEVRLTGDMGDTVAPILVSTDPLDDATEIVVDAVLSATFSEPVQWQIDALPSIFIRNLTTNQQFADFGPGDLEVTFEGNKIVIDPAIDFTEGQEYLVTISGGALQDLAGNKFDGLLTTDWTFMTIATEDTEAPLLVCLEPISISTDEDNCSAIVNLPTIEVTDNVSVTENIEISITRSDGLALDAPYSGGETQLTITATDEAGNTSEDCLVPISVNDEQAPEISCDADISIVGSAPEILAITPPTVTDNCAADPSVTFVRSDNAALTLEDPFPQGITNITWTAVDDNNNMATCTQMVTIFEQNEGPDFPNSGLGPIFILEAGTNTFSGSITTPTDGQDRFQITLGSQQTISSINGILATNAGPQGFWIGVNDTSAPNLINSPGGSIAQQPYFTTSGTYSVLVNADFAVGNTWSLTIEVSGNPDSPQDNEPPMIVCPEDIVVNNDPGVCGAIVNFSPSANDNSGSVTVSADFMTGGEFPVGTTLVTVTAMDPSENMASCTFNITVNDVEPPVAICKDITLQLDSTGFASLSPSDINDGSTDNCRVSVLAALGSFSADDLGPNIVELEIGDESGNFSSCNALVTVLPYVDESLSVTSFTLINADTDEPIKELVEGETIDINSLPTLHLDIRANTTERVESVRLSLDGALTTSRTESLMPFALFRDLPVGDYIGEDFITGNYTVSATPYSEDGLGGEMGEPFSLNFELIDGDPACVDFDVSVLRAENPSLCSGFGGLIELQVENFQEPLTFMWDHDSNLNGPLAENLPAGNYLVRVMDINYCMKELTVTLSDPEPPVVTLARFMVVRDTDSAFSLRGGMPLGGDYSGPSVDNCVFDPQSLEPGFYDITYTYEDPNTFCSSNATQQIQIVDTTVLSANGFILVDADTETELFPLLDGMQIDINTLPTLNLDIRAIGTPDVESMALSLSGALNTMRTESLEPYALFQDLPIGDYMGADFVEGDYSVSAIPYSQNSLGGDMGTSLSVDFVLFDGRPNCDDFEVFGSDVVNPSTCEGNDGFILISFLNAVGSIDIVWNHDNSLNGASGIFDLAAGEYSVTATDSATGCSHTAIITLVDPTKPEITLDPFAEVLDIDAAFELTGGMPEGGEYSGEGITNGMFDPAIGPGTYEVTYTFTEGRTGCINSATQEIVVKAESFNNIIAYWLVNADNEEDLFPITDGMKIDVNDLPTTNLDIRAETGDDTESVGFELSGTQSIMRGESVPPYALFQDLPIGDFIGHEFDLGGYTLSGTPYTQNSLNGEAGETVTIAFQFIDSTPTLAVTSFTLINAENENELFELTDGMVITINDVPSLFLDIRANTTDDVESVQLQLTGQQTSGRTENLEPYALFQDLPIGDYKGNDFEFGTYIMSATPYSGNNRTGEMGTPLSITFEIIDNLELNSLTISPNEATTLAHASFKRPTDVKQILIFDMSGRLVETYNPEYIRSGDEYILDVNFYQQGTYIVKMIDRVGTPYQKQMVVKRQ